jgi:hypothetical protein
MSNSGNCFIDLERLFSEKEPLEKKKSYEGFVDSRRVAWASLLSVSGKQI